MTGNGRVWSGSPNCNMNVHLIKLCVGIESVEHLSERQKFRLAQAKVDGGAHHLFHRTRQMPRRRDELLNGGSLFWVIKGVVLVRQNILDLREVRCDDGIKRCDIVLDPKLVVTRPHPRRAFQGWRYLSVEDAPEDLGLEGTGIEEMPDEMRTQLIELGLL